MRVEELSLSHQTLTEPVASFTKTRGLCEGRKSLSLHAYPQFSSICPSFPSDHFKGECVPISLSQMVLPTFAVRIFLLPLLLCTKDPSPHLNNIPVL